MKTLTVDDEMVSRKKMKKILDGFGECEACSTGSEALDLFRGALEKNDPFDLITLDISMPGIDGTGVLYEIRKIENEFGVPKEERIKVMMVTSRSDKATITTCLQAGCNDYVLKPFDRGLMLRKLENLGILLPQEA